MADTVQVVLWALGQGCPLRQGDAGTDPVKACVGVAKAQVYARFKCDPSAVGYYIVGDVCVTGRTSYPLLFERFRGRASAYPTSGFVISDAFRDVGGGAGLTAMCTGCPANTTWRRPAGCAGTFYKSPDDPQTQEQLERTISQ